MHTNSFIITITIENAVSKPVHPHIWVLLYNGVHCQQKLQQKLLSKTSANQNHQVLVLLSSSDLKSNQLPSTKLVNWMWLQHNLVFQVEYIKGEHCWFYCNRWGSYRWLIGMQLSLGISRCYCEHSSSNLSNWHVKICHQIFLYPPCSPDDIGRIQFSWCKSCSKSLNG